MRTSISLPRYIVRRSGRAVLIWLVLTFLVFVAFDMTRGGPCLDCGVQSPVSDVTIELRQWYRLDQPLLPRYFRYMSKVLVPYTSSVKPGESAYDDAAVNIPLADGRWLKWMNFGPSFASKLRGVNAILRDQLPISVQVIGLAFGLALVVGMTWGVRRRAPSAGRPSVMLRFTFGLPIVLAPLVIALFAISLKWFPPTGWGTRSPFVWGFIPSNLFSAAFWRYAILACAVLGLSGAAAVAQLARVGAWDAWQSEQVRVARALRLGERAITLHYVLRPALASVLAGLGWMFMALVAANLIVEWVFGIPGMGRYFIMSIINRDYPVIQNSLVFSALILLSITVFFDVLRAWLDPRVRRVTTKNA